MKNRCQWCNDTKLYQDYHDNEWGVSSYDDNHLFEMHVLETMQAGLSWYTILQKRETYRKEVFVNSIEEISNFDDDKIQSLLQNKGLIRNRLKMASITKNAQAFLNIQKEFGSFAEYIWSFTDKQVIKNSWADISQLPAKTELSDKVSKDMKKRGFSFIGSTTVYAYLQSIGVVNDHTKDCWKY